MRIVHLFNPAVDSRSLLQVAQGLLKMDVTASFSHDVMSLGSILAHKSERLEQDIRQADYIFRPNDSHFNLPEIDRLIDDWSKVIIYDISDIGDLTSRPCKMYLKRLPVHIPNVRLFPYAILDEYLIMPEVERDIDLVFLFNNPSDTYMEHHRYLVYQELLKMDLPENSIVGTTTYPDKPRTNGRRLIFEPKEGNRFIEYLSLLNRAKIVVTCSPDHPGGDSRIWEAFASGALVVTDRQRNLDHHPRHIEHCLLYDPSPIDIERAIKMALSLPEKSRIAIAREGKAWALEFHSAKYRMMKVLDAI